MNFSLAFKLPATWKIVAFTVLASLSGLTDISVFASEPVSSRGQSRSSLSRVLPRTPAQLKAAQALDNGSYTQVLQILGSDKSAIALFLRGQAFERCESDVWAEPSFVSAATAAPGDDLLCAWSIWAEINDKQYDRASLHCIRDLKRFPGSANILTMQGLALFRMNKSAEGLALLKKALRLEPNNFAARRFLAECYIFQLEKEKAVLELDELVKRYPKDPFAYLLRAKLNQDLGNYSLALKDYARVEAINPHCRYLNFRRAKMNLDRGDLKAVLPDLNRCFDSESSDQLIEKARKLRISYYEKCGQEKLALSDLNIILKGVETEKKIGSGPVTWLVDRAKAHLQLKNYALALADCETILHHVPSNCDALFIRARAYFASGKTLLALNDMNLLIERDDGVPQWYRERAVVMDKLGRSAMAKKDRERAAALEKQIQP